MATKEVVVPARTAAVPASNLAGLVGVALLNVDGFVAVQNLGRYDVEYGRAPPGRNNAAGAVADVPVWFVCRPRCWFRADLPPALDKGAQVFVRSNRSVRLAVNTSPPLDAIETI